MIGCVHGDECAGTAVTKQLLRRDRLLAARLWVVPNLNPDGVARRTRQNARGVDLNRNFPSDWQANGERGSPEYPGPEALSEPETRAAAALVRRVRPDVTIWFHQPQGLVRAWGRSRGIAKRYAQLAGLPFRAIPWPPGSGPNWQHRAFRRGTSFVVELPVGPLSAAAADRHAAAVIALATGAQ